jgi:hypothetical protein
MRVMPLIRQKMIYREDLRANPEAYYMFGDNVEKRGLGGQAGHMRGEPNAIGVPTKWAPNMQPTSFFRDEDFEEVVKLITRPIFEAREHLLQGGVVVVPLDGLGTGLSKLHEKAPLINAFIEEQIRLLGKIK